MKTLQKIAAVLVFCSVVLFAFSVDAKTVQICDMGAYALYNRANSLFSRHDVPFRFSDLKLWKKASPESPDDQYYVTGFPKGGERSRFCCRSIFLQWCRICLQNVHHGRYG